MNKLLGFGGVTSSNAARMALSILHEEQHTYSLHPNSTCCRGNIFLLLGAARGHGREPCSPLPKWLPQVDPWQSTMFASHFPEEIYVPPKFPMISRYLSAHGKPVETLFTQISSTEISSLRCSASSYGFLINILTDFPDFGGKTQKPRRDGGVACPHCR